MTLLVLAFCTLMALASLLSLSTLKLDSCALIALASILSFSQLYLDFGWVEKKMESEAVTDGITVKHVQE